jgi:hypothetical protein
MPELLNQLKRFFGDPPGTTVPANVGKGRTVVQLAQRALATVQPELYEYYRMIVANRLCRKCTGTLMFAIGGARRFESIDCPLADDNTDAVAAIIGVMDVVK